MTKCLINVTAGHYAKFYPSFTADNHLVGAIARLDVGSEEAVIVFRSSEKVVMLHVDEFSTLGDFMEAYHLVAGYDEKNKSKYKIIVWTKDGAHSAILEFATEEWFKKHPESHQTVGLPMYCFPNNRTSKDPLHLIRYLKENTTNDTIKKLKEDNTLEFECIPVMTNAVVVRFYGDNADIVSKHNREWLSKEVLLTKERYMTSKKHPNTCVGLEAYEGVTPHSSLNLAKAFSHPLQKKLSAYRVLAYASAGNLRLAPLNCEIFNTLGGWCNVDADKVDRAVLALTIVEPLVHEPSWVRVHKALDVTGNAALSRAIVAFLPNASGTSSYSSFRAEIGYALTGWLDLHPNALEQNKWVRELSTKVQEPFVRPHELQKLVSEIISDSVTDFHQVAPLIWAIYAHHSVDSLYESEELHLKYLVTKIKSQCAKAKSLCDGNKNIDEAHKLYKEARNLCDVTEMEASKRKKAVQACLQSCRDHQMDKVLKKVADGTFGSAKQKEVEMMEKLRSMFPTASKKA